MISQHTPVVARRAAPAIYRPVRQVISPKVAGQASLAFRYKPPVIQCNRQLRPVANLTGVNILTKNIHRGSGWYLLISDPKDWHVSIYPINHRGGNAITGELEFNEIHVTSPTGKHYFYTDDGVPKAVGDYGSPSAPWGNPDWATAHSWAEWVLSLNTGTCAAYLATILQEERKSKARLEQEEAEFRAMMEQYKQAPQLPPQFTTPTPPQTQPTLTVPLPQPILNVPPTQPNLTQTQTPQQLGFVPFTIQAPKKTAAKSNPAFQFG